jgi:hypothetical protein
VGTPDVRRCRNLAEGRVWALTEARKLPYAKLAETIGNIRLNSTTTIQDERLKNHQLDIALETFVLGAREVEEPTMQKMPDGTMKRA